MKPVWTVVLVITAASIGAGIMYAVQQPFFATWLRYAELPDPSDRKAHARHACREYAILSLHDPESAKFPDWDKAPVENRSANSAIYVVYLPIVAKNAFNATRKGTIACRLEDQQKHWSIIDISQIPF